MRAGGAFAAADFAVGVFTAGGFDCAGFGAAAFDADDFSATGFAALADFAAGGAATFFTGFFMVLFVGMWLSLPKTPSGSHSGLFWHLRPWAGYTWSAAKGTEMDRRLSIAHLAFADRAAISAANLALRQQFAVALRRARRPTLRRKDRVFWVVLWTIWTRWQSALVFVRLGTVVRWHRQGLRLHWSWNSRSATGPRWRIWAVGPRSTYGRIVGLSIDLASVGRPGRAPNP